MKLQDRALLVNLAIESWGMTQQDKEANAAVAQAKDSQEDATTVSKRLAPKDALKEVKSKAEEARKYVRGMTQPWSDNGDRLLDCAQLLPVQDELRRKYKPAWQAEVDKVVAKLPYFRDTWGPQHLGKLYQARLYPTAQQMAAEFTFGLSVLPLNPASKEIRMILGHEYVDQMQREAEERLVAQLYERIAEPIRNMVRRLSDPEANFKDTLVSNVEDIAQLIPALNLTGDARLAALQSQIEADLVKHDAEDLRRSPRVRSETATKAKAILERLSDYLPDSPNLNLNPEPELLVPELQTRDSGLGTRDFIAPPANDFASIVAAAAATTTVLEPVAAAPALSWRDRLRQMQAA